MANTLAALKSLPCPAGDSCTAFQCLFSHTRDQSDSDKTTDKNSLQNRSTPKVPAPSRPHPDEDTNDTPRPELQRKRVKLDIDSAYVSPRPSSSSGPAGSTKTQLGEQRRGLAASTSGTVHASGSPSAPRRVAPSSTETNENTADRQTKTQESMATVSVAPASSPGLASDARSKPIGKVPESLNPRLLKKAPTSHATRVALVKALHKEFQRLNNELKKTAKGTEKEWLMSDQELIVKTLDEEQEIATKKTSIYATSIRNRILTYKKMSLAQWKDERSKIFQSDNSNDSNSATPAVVESIETGLTSSQEFQFLSRLVLDLAPLERYGYISKVPSQDDIAAAQAAVEACGNTETCDRCTRRFQVFPGRRELDGALASNGSCTYHPGKPYYLERAPGDRSKAQRRFRCCQRNYDDEAGGCTTAQHHVFKTTDPKRLGAVLNFVPTPTNTKIPRERAVSFDCEMAYTVYGLELIRLTVVSWPAGGTLLDILVRPVGEVLDLNTRFSGVRPEDMALAERCEVGTNHQPTILPAQDPSQTPQRRLKIAASPRVARDILFTVISAETPLIGHGLENDLNAARIIHPSCIDTVLLYPHKNGLPMRHGLKHLMEAKLGRKIQVDSGEGSPEGHDSAEDAQAAGDLVRLKIRDEWKSMRLAGWTVDTNGELQAPSEVWTVVGGAQVKKSRNH
ncbi:hypothetical protein F5B22DRAFT_611058 [Xylaria bambusicola]|uniref:uncharacterized protein n=1 Tax=Xylaria bambusicola TaxID=326684 RepID=UPI002008542D|nr:uncharacterized protein F5B22DRAFT_611058 [Xylaria bambusicola]KAI0514584.1 hypothetical protein F5B22DRAFT_611058 [Xylaria bambusicola]